MEQRFVKSSWLLAGLAACAVVMVAAADIKKIWLPQQELPLRVRRSTGLSADTGWGPWSSPSNCSRSCGGGVSRQTRPCLQQTEEEALEACQGAAQKYTSCNTQPCPEGTIDFRQQQCSRFDTKPFEGKYYRWVPYVKSEEPCQLNCRPEGERFYYQHKNKVDDGTSCGEDDLDMCVDGQCVPVGCDRVLGSNLREDKCRVCGGDGSSCHLVQKSFDKSLLKVGYNDILLIPKGSTHIIIEETEPTNNYLALRSVSGEYYLNGDWRIDISGSMTIAGARFIYKRKPLGHSAPESIRALGPINESLYVVLLYQEPNRGVKYEYSVPRSTKHLTDVEYVWRTSEWSPCSRTCGKGDEQRDVRCANARTSEEADEELCNSAEKPEGVQQCSIERCNASWSVSEWSECTSKCGEEGVHYRHVTCRRQLTDHTYANVNDTECVHTGDARPEMLRPCRSNSSSCPRLYVGPWSHCSKLCGDGVQTRQLICHIRQAEGIHLLPTEVCSGNDSLPRSAPCFLRPCQGTDWLVSDWSSCEEQCGASLRTRTVVCAGVDGSVYPDSMCRASTKPKSQADCAHQKPCQYRWFASQWSQCSSKCGPGVRTRSVFCGKEVSGSNCTGLNRILGVVKDSHCLTKQKHHAVENCTGSEKNCSAVWMVGPWGKCSKDCDEGFQTRKVFCTEESGRVPVERCSKDDIPPQLQPCNSHSCSTDQSSRNTRKNYCVSKDGFKIELEKSTYDEKTTTPETTDETPEYISGSSRQTPRDEVEKESMEMDKVDVIDDSAEEDKIDGEDDIGVSGDSTNIPIDHEDKEVLNSGDIEGESSGNDVEEEILSSGSGEEQETDDEEVTSTTSPYPSTSTNINDTYLTLTSEIGISGHDEIDGTVTDTTFKLSTTFNEYDTTLVTSTSKPQSEITTNAIVKSTLIDLSTTRDEEPLSSTEAELISTSIESEQSSTTSTKREDLTGSSTAGSISLMPITNSEESSASEVSYIIFDELTESSTIEAGTLRPSLKTSTTSTAEITATTNQYEAMSTSSTTPDALTESSVLSISEFTSATETGQVTTEDIAAISESSTDRNDSKTTLIDVNTADKLRASVGNTLPVSTTIQSVEIRIKDEVNQPGMKKKSPGEKEEYGTVSSGMGDDGSTNSGDDEEPDDFETEEESSTQNRMLEVIDNSLDLITSTSTKYAAATQSNSKSTVISNEHSTSTSSPTTGSDGKSPVETEETQKSTMMSAITEATSILAEAIFGYTERGQGVDSTDAAIGSGGTPDINESSAEGSLNLFDESIDESLTEWVPLETDRSANNEVQFKDASITSDQSGDNEETSAYVSSGYQEELDGNDGSSELNNIPIDETFPDHFYEYSDNQFHEYSGSGQIEDDETHARWKRSAFKGPEENVQSQSEDTLHLNHSQTEDENSETDKHNVSDLVGRKEKDQMASTTLEPPTITTSESAITTSDSSTIASEPSTTTTAESSTITTTSEHSTTTITSDSSAVTATAESSTITSSEYYAITTTSDSSSITTTMSSLMATTDSEWVVTEVEVLLGDSTELDGTMDNVTIQPTDESYPEYDGNQDYDSLEEDGGTTETPCSSEDLDCSRTEFGCCPDGLTPARGPFLAKCPPVTSCQTTRFGCCPDLFTPAKSEDRSLCPSLVNCSALLFGCCDDGKTPRSKPDDDICMAVEDNACNYTRYGCCPDGSTAAEGPQGHGCPEDPPTEPTTTLPSSSSSSSSPEENETTTTTTTTTASTHANSTEDIGHADETTSLCNMSIAEFGCCANSSFPAHGFHQLGCCLHSDFGCCPDFITPASGPNTSDCTCETSTFGCCPDNVTSARGPDLLGCSCEGGRYGCCPDGLTTAIGPGNEGCNCNSSAFGCCPDGRTPAPSSNLSSCGCGASEFGCCLDGVTPAAGEDFLGCLEKPTDPAEVCILPKQRGNCRNYTVRWFFDMNYGGCSRFWYSGCQGNTNSFATAEQCKNKCVLPSNPLDICKLPKTKGACDGQYPSWYYNHKKSTCEQFVYGGCLGNANRFETEQDCQNHCSEQTVLDACVQKVQPGPCRGALSRWFYNNSASSCQAFKYGGCQANSNNFLTQQECQHHCSHTVGAKPNNLCKLPKSTGNCSQRVPRWFFDEATSTCDPFYYSGCGGNDNRFITENECRNVCQTKSLSKSEDVCRLPLAIGACSNFTGHFHFDSESGKCREFNYSGCQGNANRFATRIECEAQCIGDDMRSSSQQLDFTRSSTSSSLPQSNYSVGGTTLPSACLLGSDPGPCRVARNLWFFSTREYRCLPFVYGGCGGNENKFVSREQCERVCRNESVLEQDFCSIPPSPGSCHGNLIKWYFDYRDARCRAFAYTGCEGNGNRFSTEMECESLCIHLKELPVMSAVHEGDEHVQESSTHPEEHQSTENQTDTTVYMATESDADHSLTSTLCQQEKTDCNNIRCPLGVERHVTSSGCQRCTCYNPCQHVKCESGLRCVVQYRSLNTSSAQLTYTTLCRQTLKPGLCPVSDEAVTCHTAWTECRDDADCPHQLKCCYDGCTMRCAIPPQSERTSTQRPTTLTPQQVDAEDEDISATRSPRLIAEKRKYIPARILTLDGDTTAAEGSLLTLNCLAEGEPAPTILWYRAGDLVDTSRGRYKQESSGALTIVGVSRDDAGSLTCVANNSASNHDRRSLSLTVTAGKPQPAALAPVQPDETPVVRLGGPALLRCHAYGWPRPSITWWRGTLMLPRRSRHFRSRDNALRVLAVRMRDLGIYTCQAYNGLGRAVSWHVPLRAFRPVASRGAPNDGSDYPGVQASGGDSLGAPTDGRKQKQFSGEEFDKYRKFLVPAQGSVVGPELDVVSADDSESAEVAVTTQIVMTQHKFAANADIRLPCHVTGHPPPTVTWYKNGAEIASGDRVKPLDSALIILRSQWSDRGNYTCQARNEHSQSASSVEITVSGPARDANCTDNPYFANCRLIVAAKYCNNPYYAKFCCRSCTDAGQTLAKITPKTVYQIVPHRNVTTGRAGPFHDEGRAPRLRVRFGTAPPPT